MGFLEGEENKIDFVGYGITGAIWATGGTWPTRATDGTDGTDVTDGTWDTETTDTTGGTAIMDTTPITRESGCRLPPPPVFNLPPRFSEWRTHQSAAITDTIRAGERFTGLVCPTGSGKSLIAITISVLTGKRMLYLTSSKGLQSQLLRDFGCAGLVDIRGRNNYSCAASRGVTCDEGPCTVGWRCDERHRCQYLMAVRRAKQSEMVISNYSYWMASQNAGVDLGEFGLIVADEGHGIDEVVGRYLEVTLKEEDLGERWPEKVEGMQSWDWREWAEYEQDELKRDAEWLGQNIRQGDVSQNRVKQYAKAKRLADAVGCLAKIEDDWIVELEDEGRKVRVGPVWPREYTENVLWRGVGKVVVMSATLNQKTLELLGVVDDVRLLEYPHTFPLANRPVVHVPTVRMNHRTSREELEIWLRRIDQVIARHKGENGIIHTVSYARRNLVMGNSKFRDVMMSHGKRDTEARIQEFKRKGGVFVSPVVGTGYDFPGTQAEWQIVGKLPYPDTTNKLVSARCKQDKDYGAYVAMMELVQMSGRIVRSEEDKGITVIIDDSMAWFMPRYGWMAPGWFKEAFRKSVVIP